MAYVFLNTTTTAIHDVGVRALLDTHGRSATGKTYHQLLESGGTYDVISYEGNFHSIPVAGDELFLIPDESGNYLTSSQYGGIFQVVRFGSGGDAYDVAICYYLYDSGGDRYYIFAPYFRYGGSFEAIWTYNGFTDVNDLTAVSQGFDYSYTPISHIDNATGALLVYLPGIVPGVGYGTTVFKTTDGSSWTSTTASSTAIFYYVNSTASGVVVAVGYEPSVGGGTFLWTSADGGLTFTKTAKEVSDPRLYFANNVLILVTHDGTGYRVESSTDGVNWTNRGYPFGSANRTYFPFVGYANSKYVFQSSRFFTTSTDLSSFDSVVDYSTTYSHNLADGKQVNAVIWTATYDFFEVTGDIAVTTANDTAAVVIEVNTATGVISGTLRLDNETGDFAARAVYLYNYTTGALVDQTTSDGTTGAWSFTQVAPGDYFVVGAATADDYNTYNRDFDALGVITVV